MPSLREHLDSPQLTDEAGEPTGIGFLSRIGGTWVKPGVPRRRGYLFYAIVLFGGLFLIATTESEADLFTVIGVACVVLAIVGAIEVARGRPITGSLRR